MAMTGVLRPGHAQIRVLDMEESVQFYTNVLGLIETGRDSQGRVYFKAWDERDHNSIVLRQADRAGLDFFGYKVLNKATLDDLEAKLKAYGIQFVTLDKKPFYDATAPIRAKYGAQYADLIKRIEAYGIGRPRKPS